MNIIKIHAVQIAIYLHKACKRKQESNNQLFLALPFIWKFKADYVISDPFYTGLLMVHGIRNAQTHIQSTVRVKVCIDYWSLQRNMS